MRHRMVGELMTSAVVHVRPDASFKEIARLLAEHDITSVPVLDDQDRPLGVVSEADLLRHEAAVEDPAGLLPAPDLSDRDQVRSRATTARGLMSSPAVCARPEWTVVEAARLMNQRGFKRLVVVDEAGRLIGVVSRGDLLRVFLRHDTAIREEIRHDVIARLLRLSVDEVGVRVHDGQVTLSGTLKHRSVAAALTGLCRGVDGVVSVTEDLGYRVDDTPAAVTSAADGSAARQGTPGHAEIR
ncbi:CBS domain-containing protein [Streptacidiphilus sp. EB129]|uniref:CBS domain-containing protein n=1 Tax=Streptacidiphilus sp. EB129 TaxID=3156262 RepID=UPI0035154916